MRGLLIAVSIMFASVSAYACKTKEDVDAKNMEMQQAAMIAWQKNPVGLQAYARKTQEEAVAKAEEAKRAAANDMVKACAYLDEKIAELKALAE